MWSWLLANVSISNWAMVGCTCKGGEERRRLQGAQQGTSTPWVTLARVWDVPAWWHSDSKPGKRVPNRVPRATHVLLDEAPPLGGAAEELEVLVEGGAAVGGGQRGQEELQLQGLVALVHQRAHDGHQPGEGLRFGVQRAPQRGLQLAQQVASLVLFWGRGGLQQAVQLDVGQRVQLGGEKGRTGREVKPPARP